MSAIRLEAHYNHPPEKVWRALTDPELIARWLMKNDFEPRLGAEFTFKSKPFGGWDGIVHCKVTEFEPPRALAYTWNSNMIDTIVRWRLTPRDGGTHVAFEHDGFKGFNGAMAKFFMGSGWRGMVAKKIPEILDGL